MDFGAVNGPAYFHSQSLDEPPAVTMNITFHEIKDNIEVYAIRFQAHSVANRLLINIIVVPSSFFVNCCVAADNAYFRFLSCFRISIMHAIGIKLFVLKYNL